MSIEYIGRHFRIRDDLRALAERHLEKVAKFLDEPVEIRVTLEADKRRRIAELHIAHRHGVIQATEEAEAMEDAIHSAAAKAEKQARRSRKKFMDVRRRAQRMSEEQSHWPVDVVAGASIAKPDKAEIIKTNHLPIKPMTLDEAALQLEDSKNEFFVFRDSTTDRVSVLYRRRDENYGLIAPDF